MFSSWILLLARRFFLFGKPKFSGNNNQAEMCCYFGVSGTDWSRAVLAWLYIAT